MSVEGADAVKRALEAQTRAYSEATKAAQIKVATILIRKALASTPTATGTLKNSAYVRVVASKKNGIFTKAGFRAQHAGAIHKGQAKRKNGVVTFHLRNGTTGFLRKATNAILPNYAENMAAIVKAYAAAGVTPETVANPYPYRAAKRAKQYGPITYEQHQRREANKAKRAAQRAAKGA